MLTGHIDMSPGATNSVATPDIHPPPGGTHWRYDTSTTTNNNAGIRYPLTFIRRDFDARLKCKVRIPVSATGHQFLFGFSVDVDINPTQNIIEDTQSGFIVGYRSTDDNFMVIRNGGTNAVTATPTFTDAGTAVPKNASLYRTIEIQFRSQGANALVTIQNIATSAPYAASTVYTNTFTTNLPAITSTGTGGSIYMRPVLQITNKESVNHQLEVYYMELESSF